MLFNLYGSPTWICRKILAILAVIIFTALFVSPSQSITYAGYNFRQTHYGAFLNICTSGNEIDEKLKHQLKLNWVRIHQGNCQDKSVGKENIHEFFQLLEKNFIAGEFEENITYVSEKLKKDKQNIFFHKANFLVSFIDKNEEEALISALLMYDLWPLFPISKHGDGMIYLVSNYMVDRRILLVFRKICKEYRKYCEYASKPSDIEQCIANIRRCWRTKIVLVGDFLTEKFMPWTDLATDNVLIEVTNEFKGISAIYRDGKEYYLVLREKE